MFKLCIKILFFVHTMAKNKAAKNQSKLKKRYEKLTTDIWKSKCSFYTTEEIA